MGKDTFQLDEESSRFSPEQRASSNSEELESLIEQVKAGRSLEVFTAKAAQQAVEEIDTSEKWTQDPDAPDIIAAVSEESAARKKEVVTLTEDTNHKIGEVLSLNPVTLESLPANANALRAEDLLQQAPANDVTPEPFTLEPMHAQLESLQQGAQVAEKSPIVSPEAAVAVAAAAGAVAVVAAERLQPVAEAPVAEAPVVEAPAAEVPSEALVGTPTVTLEHPAGSAERLIQDLGQSLESAKKRVGELFANLDKNKDGIHDEQELLAFEEQFKNDPQVLALKKLILDNQDHPNEDVRNAVSTKYAELFEGASNIDNYIHEQMARLRAEKFAPTPEAPIPTPEASEISLEQTEEIEHQVTVRSQEAFAAMKELVELARLPGRDDEKVAMRGKIEELLQQNQEALQQIQHTSVNESAKDLQVFIQNALGGVDQLLSGGQLTDDERSRVYRNIGFEMTSIHEELKMIAEQRKGMEEHRMNEAKEQMEDVSFDQEISDLEGQNQRLEAVLAKHQDLTDDPRRQTVETHLLLGKARGEALKAEREVGRLSAAMRKEANPQQLQGLQMQKTAMEAYRATKFAEAANYDKQALQHEMTLEQALNSLGQATPEKTVVDTEAPASQEKSKHHELFTQTAAGLDALVAEFSKYQQAGSTSIRKLGKLMANLDPARFPNDAEIVAAHALCASLQKAFAGDTTEWKNFQTNYATWKDKYGLGEKASSQEQAKPVTEQQKQAAFESVASLFDAKMKRLEKEFSEASAGGNEVKMKEIAEQMQKQLKEGLDQRKDALSKLYKIAPGARLLSQKMQIGLLEQEEEMIMSRLDHQDGQLKLIELNKEKNALDEKIEKLQAQIDSPALIGKKEAGSGMSFEGGDTTALEAELKDLQLKLAKVSESITVTEAAMLTALSRIAESSKKRALYQTDMNEALAEEAKPEHTPLAEKEFEEKSMDQGGSGKAFEITGKSAMKVMDTVAAAVFGGEFDKLAAGAMDVADKGINKAVDYATGDREEYTPMALDTKKVFKSSEKSDKPAFTKQEEAEMKKEYVDSGTISKEDFEKLKTLSLIKNQSLKKSFVEMKLLPETVLENTPANTNDVEVEAEAPAQTKKAA
jgi:hypothetical protein